jgi:phosphate starvation-inducible PhoH-like protein
MPKRRKKRPIVNEEEIEKIRTSLARRNVKLKKTSLTDKQNQLLKIIFDNDSKIIFISGPAGTSKTYVAIYGALQLYNMNNDRGITYVRTIAESGEKSLGALPGEMAEKINPYMMPMNEKLDELLIPGQASILREKDIVKGMPVNYLRGASWMDEIVIADESQNFTFKELTTLMTRLGRGSKLIICGDPMQSDINGKSGFADMYSVFNDDESKNKGIHTFNFGAEDIMRSEILKFVIKKIQNKKTKT